MIGEKPKGIRAHLTLAYPALMLGIFFIAKRRVETFESDEIIKRISGY